MIVALAIGVIADLCGGGPAPDAQPSAEEAVLYAAAGDTERSAGALRTAAIAYRHALALDPQNAHAREALAALCKEDSARDVDAMLSDAIGRYRAADYRNARRALDDVLAADDRQAAAHFFRGMIAWRESDLRRAKDEFDRAATDADFAGAAADMRRLLVRDGRWSAQLLLEPGYDSNVEQLPDTPPSMSKFGPPQGDSDYLALLTLGTRPLRGLSIRDTVFWRDQWKLDEFDLFGESAQVDWRGVLGRHTVGLRYVFDYDLLDGANYLFAHRGVVAYGYSISSSASLGVSYSLRRRDYETAQTAAFSGFVHTLSADASFTLGTRVTVALSALAQREITEDPSFTYDGAGGLMQARWRVLSDFFVTGIAQALFSSYDNPDPSGILRRDSLLAGELDLQYDLGDRVSLLAAAQVARNFSDIEDFRYMKFMARAGVALYLGRP